MAKLADLLKRGTVPQVTPLGPERFDGHTLTINTQTFELTNDRNGNSGEVMRGYRFEAYDQTDAQQIRFTTQSKALVQQIEEQFLPFLEEIGPELEVTIKSEPSRKNEGRKVYRFV